MAEQCCNVDMRQERVDRDGDTYLRCPKCKRPAVVSKRQMPHLDWTGLWGIPQSGNDEGDE